MDYAESYRDTLEALTRPLTPADGTPEDEIVAGEQRIGARLPAALRDYYLLAGQFDQINHAHNRLYSPEEWEVQAGRLLFMEENQVVVVWAVEASAAPDDDPPVWQGVPVEGQPMEWHIEHPHVSEFLTQMAYLQGVFGGMEATLEDYIEISPEDLESIRSVWPLVGEMGAMQVFRRDGQVLCALTGGDTVELYLAGRTQDDLDALEMELSELLGIEDEDEDEEHD